MQIKNYLVKIAVINQYAVNAVSAISKAVAAFVGIAVMNAAVGNEVPPQPYHVEVIVFERLASTNDAPEYWPKNIALAYPPDYRLVAGEKTEAMIKQSSDSASQLNTEMASIAAEQGTSAKLSPRSKRLLPERPIETYLLQDQALSLSRTKQLRVLFHKAWQQGLLATEQAPYVVIAGGDQFDGKHELGGTIRFSVNKFIHVDTELWLTQFTPNYGQISEWPSVPNEPTLTAEFNYGDGQDSRFKIDINKNASNSSDQQLTGHQPTNNFFSGSRINNAVGEIQLAPSGLGLGSDQGQRRGGKFLPNEIIIIEQSRRMRSNELQYIDHPRLGILLKIIPISFAEAAKLEPAI
jgi:hypothetical protein